MKNLPNDRKTYVQQGQIFFLRPQESVRKNMNNEIVETDKKIRLQQDQLYTLQHQFQLYRQQEQAEKR
jgi:chaperonin cofactor prefoldin